MITAGFENKYNTATFVLYKGRYILHYVPNTNVFPRDLCEFFRKLMPIIVDHVRDPAATVIGNRGQGVVLEKKVIISVG